ncbi:MAG: IclR family transcriptional regulator [Streptosporangiaceae bacterium]
MQKNGPDTGARPPSYPIASVDNALRLLLMFRDRHSVRLSEASAYLGVAHSTAHRLLAMLAYHGFVRRESRTRAYVAGPALLEVGLAVVRGMDIRGYARPHLEAVAAAFNETVHLATLEGDKVRYLDAVESTKALRVAARTGLVLPAHCSALGKSLLAELPAEHFRELYPGNGPLTAETDRSITSVSALQRELRQVRRRGYATNNEESEDGVASVAAAVRGPSGAVIAALSVAAPTRRMTARRRGEMARLLREVAGELGASVP